MMLRIIIHALFTIFLVGQVNAQETSDDSSDTNSNSREFNLSVFTGSSFFGSKNEMESNMSSSGLGDIHYFWGSSHPYPYTKKHPIFDIEASYYLTQQKGISLNFGLINNIEVRGYDSDLGMLGHMNLKSEIWTISLNYAYRSKNRKHNFFVGPTYFIHSLKKALGPKKSHLDNYMIPGIYLGYSVQILQKRHWFIALKTNYRWAPKSNIGPFVDEYSGYNSTIVTSEFPRTKVNISCLNVGLHLGVRICKD